MPAIAKEMKEVEIKTLKGEALNWVVALSQRFIPHFEEVTSITIKKVKDGSLPPFVTLSKNNEVIVISDDKKIKNGIYAPSFSIENLSKTLSKYRITKKIIGDSWFVSCENIKNGKVSANKVDCTATDTSFANAACRAIAMYVLGEKVSIPAQLIPQMVEVNTNELCDEDLDRLVAKAEGIVDIDEESADIVKSYKPSSDWGLGGKLQDKYDIEIVRTETNGKPQYTAKCEESRGGAYGYGDTRLVAICRAIAVARFGQTVELKI